MGIRLLKEEDIGQLIEIHQKFYKDDFPFPLERVEKLLDLYVVDDCDGNIITFGALEMSLEAVVLTDKDYCISGRREALYQLINALLFNTQRHNFDMFHCTIQDRKWESHLKKVGFKECKGKYLYIKV